jgi:hypothetical protein
LKPCWTTHLPTGAAACVCNTDTSSTIMLKILAPVGHAPTSLPRAGDAFTSNVSAYQLVNAKWAVEPVRTLSASVPTCTVMRAAAVTPFTVAAPAGPRAALIKALAAGGGSCSAVSKPASSLLTAHCTALPAGRCHNLALRS